MPRTKSKLTKQQVIAIKRKRGELDMSITDLANATGVSKWTLIDIFKHDHRNVNSITFKKLNDWLIDKYTNPPQEVLVKLPKEPNQAKIIKDTNLQSSSDFKELVSIVKDTNRQLQIQTIAFNEMKEAFEQLTNVFKGKNDVWDEDVSEDDPEAEF